MRVAEQVGLVRLVSPVVVPVLTKSTGRVPRRRPMQEGRRVGTITNRSLAMLAVSVGTTARQVVVVSAPSTVVLPENLVIA